MLDIFKDSSAYEWMTEDAREETRQQLLAALEGSRQIIIDLVSNRFPKLARLAKKQVRTIENLNRLQQLMLHCSLAQDAAEVEVLLLDLDEDEQS